MTNYYAIDALQRPVARLTSMKAATAAAGEGGFVAYGPEDLLDKQTKAQMELTRAYAVARKDSPAASLDELDDAAGHMYRTAPEFTNIKKISAAEIAERAFKALVDAFNVKPPRARAAKPDDGDAPKAKPLPRGRGAKTNVKDHLRKLFSRVGKRFTLEQTVRIDDELAYNAMSITTAISDLKNPKYAGGEVIIIERKKVGDEIHYERVG